jgi:FkbM family methyltransferase
MTFYEHLARAGFWPEVIYDIGASSGGWSNRVARLFPQATFHLFEPLANHVARYHDGLQQLRANHPRYHVYPVALGESFGSATLAIGANAAGSTVLAVGGASSIFPKAITVPQHSLDELFKAGIVTPAQLLKLDVQGSEDRILRGANHVLSSTQVLQIECWLYPGYGPETAMMADIVKMLGEHGFIAVECSNPYYGDAHHCTPWIFILSVRI